MHVYVFDNTRGEKFVVPNVDSASVHIGGKRAPCLVTFKQGEQPKNNWVILSDDIIAILPEENPSERAKLLETRQRPI